MDDEIFEDFQRSFPDISLDHLRELEDFKSEQAKQRWRPWLMKYEKKVDKFNFGTLLRIHASDPELREDNAMFGTYCVIVEYTYIHTRATVIFITLTHSH
jgi:hypothetical protein